MQGRCLLLSVGNSLISVVKKKKKSQLISVREISSIRLIFGKRGGPDTTYKVAIKFAYGSPFGLVVRRVNPIDWI